MAISNAFLEYFRSEFFSGNPAEFEAFRAQLLRPLKKTLRINPSRANPAEFVAEKTRAGWTFSPTENATAFRIDRADTSVAL